MSILSDANKTISTHNALHLVRGAAIRTATVTLIALIAVMLLGACGRGEETPSPSPTEAVAVDAPAAADSAAAQPSSPLTEAEPLAEEQAYPPPSEDAGPTTAPVAATLDANGNTAVFQPLEVAEDSQCEIESHIDLAGYPDLEEQLGCPIADASTAPVAINEFGEGPVFDRFMLWFSTDSLIYVMYPDGGWIAYEDTWQEGEPTFTCNPLEGEPDSPPLPRRGFGKLWCENQDIQNIMGTVPREERLCQHSVVQPFADGRLLACFEDATIRYFRVMNDSRWDVVVQ